MKLSRISRVGVHLAAFPGPLDHVDHDRHHRVLGPLVGAGERLWPAGREVQPEHLAEQGLADPPLHRREQPDDLAQGGWKEGLTGGGTRRPFRRWSLRRRAIRRILGRRPRRRWAAARLELGQEFRQLGDQPRLLVPLEFGQHVLLGRKVEVERAPGHARRRRDVAHVGGRHPGPLELSQRRRVDPLAGLPALRVPAFDRRTSTDLVFRWRHGGSFMGPVAECQ
jgi:hypothetical protein